jgi:hypothetical protein
MRSAPHGGSRSLNSTGCLLTRVPYESQHLPIECNPQLMEGRPFSGATRAAAMPHADHPAHPLSVLLWGGGQSEQSAVTTQQMAQMLRQHSRRTHPQRKVVIPCRPSGWCKSSDRAVGAGPRANHCAKIAGALSTPLGWCKSLNLPTAS